MTPLAELPAELRPAEATPTGKLALQLGEAEAEVQPELRLERISDEYALWELGPDSWLAIKWGEPVAEGDEPREPKPSEAMHELALPKDEAMGYITVATVATVRAVEVKAMEEEPEPEAEKPAKAKPKPRAKRKPKAKAEPEVEAEVEAEPEAALEPIEGTDGYYRQRLGTNREGKFMYALWLDDGEEREQIGSLPMTIVDVNFTARQHAKGAS
jgi:hypothetical protein